MADTRQLWKRAEGVEGLTCSVCGWQVPLAELIHKVESSGKEVNRDEIRAVGDEVFQKHTCVKA